MIFKTLNDVYKEKLIDNEIHEVLLKKDLVIRRHIDINDIASVSELSNDKGIVYKSRCVIATKDGNVYCVKHKFEEVIKLKQPIKVNGFR